MKTHTLSLSLIYPAYKAIHILLLILTEHTFRIQASCARFFHACGLSVCDSYSSRKLGATDHTPAYSYRGSV